MEKRYFNSKQHLPNRRTAKQTYYLLLVLGYFVCFNFFSVSKAQTGFWVQANGSYNGTVKSFAVSGTNLFIGTSGDGVLLSTDNGISWTAANTGLTNTYVQSLAPDMSGNLFAGTFGGVFLSTDNGTSWTQAGLISYSVDALAVSGTNLFAGTYFGVFRSTDKGTNWTQTGLTSNHVNALAPDMSGNIFAGTSGGVFLSTDNGISWTQVNTGLTSTNVRSLAPDLSGNLFAGTLGGGVFRSTDNGRSWTEVNTGLINTYVNALAPDLSGNLFAGTSGGGVFLSTNNGTSWTEVNTGLTNTTVLSLAPDLSGNLFAGTTHGAFRLTNNVTNWTAILRELTNPFVYALAPDLSGNLFAGTLGGGIFRSTDNGTSWTAVNTDLTNIYIWTLVASGTNLFAGTGGGIFLSTNNGTSWTAVNTGLTNTDVRSLVVSGTILFAGTGGGVFRSTDNGTSWTQTGLTSYFVYALAVSGTNLFAGTYGGGVFLSTDNGTSWTQTGLTSYSVYALAVSGTNLFAGTYGGGVFRSTNNGTTWTAINNGLTWYTVYTLVINSIGHIFAGTNGSVFASTNNGRNWTQINSGLTSTVVRVLVINLSGHIFAGTHDGVFRSFESTTEEVRYINISLRIEDNGGSFRTLNFGLHTSATYCIDTLLDKRISTFIPPLGIFDARLIDPRGYSDCFGWGVLSDFRVFIDTAQIDTYKVQFQPGEHGYPMTFTWQNLNLYYSGQVRLMDLFGGVIVDVDMKAETSYVLTHTGIDRLLIITNGPIPMPQVPIISDIDGNGYLTSARLSATISPYSYSAHVWFEWGRTTSYGRKTLQQNIDGRANIDAIIFGLFPNTTYYYRVISENSNGTSYSLYHSFTTTRMRNRGYHAFPFKVQNNTFDSAMVIFGLDTSANYCLESWLYQPILPPPEYSEIDIRLLDPRETVGSCFGSGIGVDLRRLESDVQIDTYRVVFQPGSGGYPITFSWPNLVSFYSGSVRLKDKYDLAVVDVDMKEQTSYLLKDKLLDELLIITEAPYNIFTLEVDSISSSSAVLRGAFNPSGQHTAGWFQWGTSPTYTDSTPRKYLGNGNANVVFKRRIIGLSPNTIYHYRALVYNSTGLYYGANRTFTTTMITSNLENKLDVQTFAIEQNYPNPFNPLTVIRYQLPVTSKVSLKIYDVLGQVVATLVDEIQEAGYKSVTWNANNIASGVYFYRLQAGTFTKTNKLLLLK